jgi:cyclic pyranopterin phosphate synthase
VDKLRVSVTDRCNLRCTYCLPPWGVPLVSHDEVLRYEEIAEIVRTFVRTAGLGVVRLTGGEPLLRGGLSELVRQLAATGVEVALTTNGHLLPAYAAELREAGLSRVNISLDTLRAEAYATLTGGGEVEAALAGIEAAGIAGLHPIKVNTVVLRGVNEDELPALVRFARARGLSLRFLEAMRIGELRKGHAERFVSLGEMLRHLGEEFEVDLGPHPEGATARPARLKDRGTGEETTVGFIPSESAPFCRTCRRLRLTSRGRLLACLLSDRGVDLRSWVRDPGRDETTFREKVRRTLSLKPDTRGAENTEFMSRLGG